MCDKVAVLDNGKIVKVENITNIDDNAEAVETVEIKANYLEKAKNIIKEKFQIDTIIDNNHINIILPANKLPQVIKELAVADVEIKAVIPKEHSLEDIFFDATKGGK